MKQEQVLSRTCIVLLNESERDVFRTFQPGRLDGDEHLLLGVPGVVQSCCDPDLGEIDCHRNLQKRKREINKQTNGDGLAISGYSDPN